MRQEMMYQQNQEPELQTEQTLQQQQRFEAAPVLYSLDTDGIPPFLQKIRETITDRPQAKTTVFITGESGVGKELVAGQLIYEVLQTNPDTDIGFLSLGMAIRAARDEERVKKYAEKYGTTMITRDGVDYDEQDYQSASRMMHALIEDFYANDSGKPKLVVVETVAYTYPKFDHGSSTIQRQMELAKQDGFARRNVFFLGLIADDTVQDATFASRNAAASASPEEVNIIFQKQGLRRDVQFRKPDDLKKFIATRGSQFARERNRETLNNNILNASRFLYFTTEAADAIRQNNGILTREMLSHDSIRRSAHRAYAEHMINNIWEIEPPQHGIVAENDFLQLPNIPYYVSLTQKYALVH